MSMFETFPAEFVLQHPLTHPILWFWQQKTEVRSPKSSLEIFEISDFSAVLANILSSDGSRKFSMCDMTMVSKVLSLVRAF